MFFCEECRVKNDWPRSMGYPFMGVSRGNCELCNKHGLCHDVPSSGLPMPKRKAKTKKRKEG